MTAEHEHEHGSTPAETVVVMITAPADKGDEIADAIVAQRLAACVNVVPSRSVYRWEGEVRREDEALLVVKTTADAVQALTAAVREIHPHENFELIAMRIAGGPRSYLEWIVSETRRS